MRRLPNRQQAKRNFLSFPQEEDTIFKEIYLSPPQRGTACPPKAGKGWVTLRKEYQ
jgi:hypothetical protein